MRSKKERERSKRLEFSIVFGAICKIIANIIFCFFLEKHYLISFFIILSIVNAVFLILYFKKKVKIALFFILSIVLDTPTLFACLLIFNKPELVLFPFVVLSMYACFNTLFIRSSTIKFFLFVFIFVDVLILCLVFNFSIISKIIFVILGFLIYWIILNEHYVYNNFAKDLVTFKTRLEKSKKDLILGIVNALKYRDNDTGIHNLRIAYMSKLMSSILNMPLIFTDTIYYASSLHDVGKMAIPDNILLKPGKLDLEERVIIEKHSALGGSFIRKALGDGGIAFLRDMSYNISMYHHERWDGTGYPEKLFGDRIPIEARIVSILDVFDALSFDRPYKEAWDTSRVVTFIKENSGKMFDPRIVDIFLENIEVFISIRDKSFDDLSTYL